MTGYRSRFFRHSCTASGCYVDQLPSWDDFIDCFPRNIRPTDVDGLVEINDHILVLEEKCCGKAPDEGQRRALKALASRDRVTVMFMRPGGKRTDMQVLIYPDPQGWQDVTRDWVKAWLRNWAAEAERTAA